MGRDRRLETHRRRNEKLNLTGRHPCRPCRQSSSRVVRSDERAHLRNAERDEGAGAPPSTGTRSDAYFTVKKPDMPAAACPGTVQMYLYRPRFKVTFSVAL